MPRSQNRASPDFPATPELSVVPRRSAFRLEACRAVRLRALVLGLSLIAITTRAAPAAEPASPIEPATPPPSAPPTTAPGESTSGESPPGEPAEAPPLSEEELRLLQQSLEADTAARESAGSGQSAQTAPAPLATVSSALQSMNPDIALILDVAAAAFSVEEPLQLGGHDPNRTGFNLQQLEMSIGASVDPYFRFDSNLVFSQFGVEIEEAYASALALPWNLKARAGQFLTRIGRLNPTHPHAWSFVDQPLVNGKFFGGEGNRGLGLELSWLSPLPWYAEVVGSATDAAGDCCARSFYGAEDLGVRGPLELLYTISLKQFFPFGSDLSLLWGLSGQLGPNPTGNGNRSQILATDLYLRYRPVRSASRQSLSLQLELMQRNRQVPHGLLQDYGGYTQLTWHFAPRWETAARAELVSGLEDDYLDPEWTEHRTRYSAQLTHYPSHFSRLRLQGSYDDPRWLEEPIWAVMLALEVLVGAHGSHSF